MMPMKGTAQHDPPSHFRMRANNERKLPPTGRTGEGAGPLVETRRLALVLFACASPSRQAATHDTVFNGSLYRVKRARARFGTRRGAMLIAEVLRRNGHQRLSERRRRHGNTSPRTEPYTPFFLRFWAPHRGILARRGMHRVVGSPSDKRKRADQEVASSSAAVAATRILHFSQIHRSIITHQTKW